MLKVYSKIKTNRFKYAIKLVLQEVCDLEYDIVYDKKELKAHDLVINYSGERIEGSFQIHPFGLLSEKDFRQFDLTFNYGGKEMIKLFLTEFDHLGFDLFSASFFLATRMEEYWKHEKDEHDRYMAKNSVLHKLGVLHLPLINIWGKVFIEKINSFFNQTLTYKKSFEIINTIDVDNAWAYKNKGILRIIGGIGKTVLQGNLYDLKNRIQVLLFKKKDPYDTYQYIETISKQKKVKSIYFFLLGDRANYDKNVPYNNKKLKKLIRKIAKTNPIGIHPSYQSYLDAQKQQLEKQRLENIVQKPITNVRKHFLRLTIPESYRILEKNKLYNDYTMGYADAVGFRAGICTPFTFFDLLQDKELHLKVHPFAYMDGTLCQYLGLSPAEAIEKIEQLKQNVKNVDGVFIGIWHNETLNNKGLWKGWKTVFERGLER